MEHIQHLTLTWLHAPPRGKSSRPARVVAYERPSREQVRMLAERHHRQLVDAKRRSGSRHEMLRAQTEALRQAMHELGAERWHAFMNAYTEESSAVEREWMARQSARLSRQPLNPVLTNAFTFTVTMLAVVAAISYAP